MNGQPPGAADARMRLDDRYQLITQAGSGGMSVVWHAFDDVWAATWPSNCCRSVWPPIRRSRTGVKVLDVGISALAGDAQNDGGDVFGTAAYLAPERFTDTDLLAVPCP